MLDVLERMCDYDGAAHLNESVKNCRGVGRMIGDR